MKKSNLGSLIIGLCLLLLPALSVPAFGSTPSTFTITAEELTQLDETLTKLETNNNALRTSLTGSTADLAIVKEQLMKSQNLIALLQMQLDESKANLAKARLSSVTAQSKLDEVNQSFEQYAKEQKAIQNKLKRQRNFYAVLVAAATTYLIVK